MKTANDRRRVARKARARAREVPRPFEMPWGKGRIVEEASTTTPWHEPTIQLLEYEDGSLSVRFCHYDHAGRFQRSPLMIGADVIPELRGALAKAPRLRALLRKLAR